MPELKLEIGYKSAVKTGYATGIKRIKFDMIHIFSREIMGGNIIPKSLPLSL